MLMPDRFTNEEDARPRFGFNGMEREDEIAGLGNSLNFGARQYDSRIIRFSKLDRFKNKFHNLTPYAFAANTPINGIDKNGDSLYILAYVVNDHRGDNMFKSAAFTRKRDIEKSENFDPERDKVKMIEFEDLSTIITDIDAKVSEFSSKYGKTVEFGIWSHNGGNDGPMGSIYTAGLYQKDGKHMNFRGWEEINFNWETNSEHNRALFYGC